ncbi:HAD family hydrolase [Halopseudomonas pelagia]|uniref:HAD family hydrolase n=1 Tax=Halopseudomonas pelagia TaxID=553151 RepID=UPI00039CAD28|nr:HAD family hydrolase [Halopseudomonas pelagia]|tara:strand:+ start:1342 stop:1929 length:588 start_codon:yes stop_codon:yes gene_type:complete
MHDLKAWVFDLDGTLTLAQHDFAAIRRELGIPAGDDILCFIASRPLSEREQLSSQLDAIEMRLAAEVRAAPGAAELIRHLHESGRHIGILTRNLQQVARSSLELLGVLDCFAPEHILGRDQALPKPDPDGIHQLLGRWSVARTQAVMVGDFRFDLEAGRAAGCHTCLVHADNQWPELADWHVTDCRDLMVQLTPP